MKTAEKIDLYKLHKDEYAATRKPAFVNVGKANYLAILGQGEPGGTVFEEKIGALYAIAFTMKMTRKFGGLQDYAVCKLEAQWWVDGDEAGFQRVPRKDWRWKLLIRTPEFVEEAELTATAEKLVKKGKGTAVCEVQLESITEGRCVQMLHVGPYEREPESILLMQAHAETNKLKLHGRHHEIYLSDPRRVDPEKLKTILRIPVARA